MTRRGISAPCRTNAHSVASFFECSVVVDFRQTQFWGIFLDISFAECNLVVPLLLLPVLIADLITLPSFFHGWM